MRKCFVGVATSEHLGTLMFGSSETGIISTITSKEVSQKNHIELTCMKEEIKTMKMGHKCAVSSAASTGYGLVSVTFARPPLGQNRKEILVPQRMYNRVVTLERGFADQ